MNLTFQTAPLLIMSFLNSIFNKLFSKNKHDVQNFPPQPKEPYPDPVYGPPNSPEKEREQRVVEEVYTHLYSRELVPNELVVEMTEYFVRAYNLKLVEVKDPEWECYIKGNLPYMTCETLTNCRDFAAEFNTLISCYEFNLECIREFQDRCFDQCLHLDNFLD